VNDVARQRLLRLIGLGVRARSAVVGVQQVRQAAKTGKLAYAVIAPDASQNSLDKLVPLLRARHIQYADAVSAAELGAAVGRESTAAVGIVDRQLAKGIRDIVESSDSGAAESDRRSV
jgi:ribosomal protein L7Ae-like RNA K-turn-binding protein